PVPENIWLVALAGVPFGLSVASINVAKHTDKLDDDKKKGVGTFPVRVGQTIARYTTIAAVLFAYGVVVYLVASGYFSTFMLLVLFGIKRAFYVLAVLAKPRPEGPPAGFELFWPTWFSGFAFYHNRMFGGMFVLGMLLDLVFRQFPLPFDINWFGTIALGVGLLIAGFNYFKEKAKSKK
ncbi:MAG TPA: hypothetical protein DCG54_05545, partial [Anaerolineae bacterium]|nr:hypothetical protein [Anaerolineae bacterium]